MLLKAPAHAAAARQANTVQQEHQAAKIARPENGPEPAHQVVHYIALQDINVRETAQ